MVRLFQIGMCLVAIALSLPAHAAEPLFISEAKIDVMGQNAADARALGMKQAKREALDALFKKFVPEHKSSIMDGLSDKRIEKLVRKVELADESEDGNRFRAIVKISYSAAMFNDLITKKIEAVESDQQLLTTASLVLPIFETSDRLYLFESTNPWAKAWANIARNIGRGQLITPYGDGVDHSMMSAREAEKADFRSFSPLRRRYGVRDVVILHARFVSKSDMGGPVKIDAEEDDEEDEDEDDGAKKKRKNTLALEVTERRVQANEDEIKTIEYIMDAAEDKAKLMDRAARDLGIYVMNMQGRTADKVAESRKEFNRLLIVTPVTTMQRFSWVKERLKHVPGVERLEVLALKPEQADLQLFYTGTREVLIESMGDTGLKFDDRTQYVEIRL